MRQQEIFTDRELQSFSRWIDCSTYKSFLLVCGNNTRKSLSIDAAIYNCKDQHKITWFNDFSSNPTYQSVVKGVETFRNNDCDCILAVGGGSAMDVAKCIKLYATMQGDGKNGEFLKGDVRTNNICLAVMPTTAGTGSEATKFAVIYYDGKKQSVSHEMCIPKAVFFNPDALANLPEYHKKSAMLDALSHSLESYWSINSTVESRYYSREALEIICSFQEAYLSGKSSVNMMMLRAANIAGKAINITQTTAGHALCYKITSECGIAHGHAAFLCNVELLNWMAKNISLCVDPRGEEHLLKVFESIADGFNCNTINDVYIKLKEMIITLGLKRPVLDCTQINEIIMGVNMDRLKNTPVMLDYNSIKSIYSKVLNIK